MERSYIHVGTLPLELVIEDPDPPIRIEPGQPFDFDFASHQEHSLIAAHVIRPIATLTAAALITEAEAVATVVELAGGPSTITDLDERARVETLLNAGLEMCTDIAQTPSADLVSVTDDYASM